MPKNTHFTDDAPAVINQADLDHANEKLHRENDDDQHSDKTTSDRDHVDNHQDHSPNGKGEKLEQLGTYDKYELTEEDCYQELGFCFPSWKKWYILSVIFNVVPSL